MATGSAAGSPARRPGVARPPPPVFVATRIVLATAACSGGSPSPDDDVPLRDDHHVASVGAGHEGDTDPPEPDGDTGDGGGVEEWQASPGSPPVELSDDFTCGREETGDLAWMGYYDCPPPPEGAIVVETRTAKAFQDFWGSGVTAYLLKMHAWGCPSVRAVQLKNN